MQNKVVKNDFWSSYQCIFVDSEKFSWLYRKIHESKQVKAMNLQVYVDFD